MINMFKKPSSCQLVIVLCVVIIGCICCTIYLGVYLIPPAEDIETNVITIRELSTCDGLDSTGKPIWIPSAISSTMSQISVCGYAEVAPNFRNFSVVWYNNSQQVFHDIVFTDSKKIFFVSVYRPSSNDLPTGEYEVHVIKHLSIRKTTFRIMIE